MKQSCLAVMLAVSTIACGQSVSPAIDAATPLDSQVEVDGGGRDLDAAPPDDDGDGVPRGTDCDDTDPTIGRTGTEVCSAGCEAGTVECVDGVRGACNAPTDCVCDAGETRVAACGMCGMQAQNCGPDGTWEDTSACLNEGACPPGTVDDDRSYCGRRQRLCGSDCEWLAWDELEPRGVCEPGVRVACVGGGSAICTDFCTTGGPCVPVDDGAN